MPLSEIIRGKIRSEGPLTVADYMALALTHPEHGYYVTRDPFGERGDFVTSPEISQIFGEMLGVWCGQFWRQMGEPRLALVELGPGRGTLMRDLLRATRHVAGFHESLCLVLVEASPALARLQRAVLTDMHSRISWQPNIEELPDLPAIFIANEFFDALPIRQFVRTPEGLQEKFVDLDPETDDFCFVVKEMGLQLVKGGAYSGDEAVVESSPASRALASRMAAHLAAHRGGALIVDYGYTGGSRGNTLQAVKAHGFHPVLNDPGTADITAHVDFDALAEVFAQAGLHVHGPVAQGTFLSRLGAEVRAETLLKRAQGAQAEAIVSGLRRLIRADAMGELFKALGVSSFPDTPAGFGSAK